MVPCSKYLTEANEKMFIGYNLFMLQKSNIDKTVGKILKTKACLNCCKIPNPEIPFVQIAFLFMTT